MEYSVDEIEVLKKKYKLNQEEYNEMYKKCKYVTFFNCTKSSNPTAIFVGGQTGSGKGGIDVYSEKEFKEKGMSAALIDIDVYRALHPKASEILTQHPTIYTDITAEDTGKIVKQILNYAINNKYNFIFEGTLKNTEAFETMKKMPVHFNKIVRVMAVYKKESLLTAFERNDEQVNITGYGRFTNVETHNKTYNGVLNTIKKIEENSDITIEIFIRGNDMTSPIKIYTKNEERKKPSQVLYDARLNESNKKSNEEIEKRLEKLINNLRPKDKYEEEQLGKLINEINC